MNQKSQPKQQEPIAIVGISGLFPGSVDIAAFWNNILKGADLITDIPQDSHWSVADYFAEDALKRPASALDKTYAKRGGFLPKVPFDPLKEGIPPSLLPATDTSQLLALMVARTALEECFGGAVEQADRSRVSCILGVTSGQELFGQMAGRLAWPQWIAGMRAAGIDEEAAKKAADEIAKTFTPWSEASFPGLLGNVVAGRIANRLDLGGSNAVTDAACASSFAASCCSAGPTSCSPVASTPSTTSSCTCASPRRRRCRRRATAGPLMRRVTARCSVRGSACWRSSA
jgi:acyl transferase domain-containing protein